MGVGVRILNIEVFAGPCVNFEVGVEPIPVESAVPLAWSVELASLPCVDAISAGTGVV